MKQQKKQGSITVFFSYAQADKAVRNQLAIYLSQLKRDELIEEWSDQQILAGSDRDQAIDLALHSANIILLLISADFLASDYCYNIEMQQALERHQRGEARVIPIIVRPCDWQHSPFAYLQCLPRNTKPITTWDNQDEAFVDVVAGIRKVISEIHFPDPTEENVADLLTSSSRAQTVPPLFVPSWDNVQPAGEDRHLPVYLLLDTSESMRGAPIEALRQGLELFQREISSDPFARDIIKVGVITFGRRARLVTEGLVPSLQLSISYLEADDPVSIAHPSYSETRISKRFDLALQILVESMDRDVVKAVPGGRKGDWRPVVFVLTDGQPTDEHGHKAGYLWPTVKRHIVNRPKGYIEPSVIVAVGVGPNPDDATLKKMSTGTAFRMGTDAASFVSLFQYLDQLVEDN